MLARDGDGREARFLDLGRDRALGGDRREAAGRAEDVAEVVGVRALANTNVPDSSNLSFINVEFDCDLETSPKSIGDVIKGV